MPSSEENLKRKVRYQMQKSKAQTHQTNGQQLSHSRLGTVIFLCRQ